MATLIAPEYFNNHIAVEGEIIVKSVPNDAGSVLVWNPITKKISQRTKAEIIGDLDLMTLSTHQFVNGQKYFISSGIADEFANKLWVRSEDGSEPGITFWKTGHVSSTLTLRDDGFHFGVASKNHYDPVKAERFIKNGSSDNYFLRGDGTDYDSRKKEDSWFHSTRDFPSGTLIQTDINYSQSAGDQFLLEMKGNMYGGGLPLDAKIQGYIYNDTIIQSGGYSTLHYFHYIIALNNNGQLCFWIPPMSYWQGFDVKVTAGYGGLDQGKNRVLSITDSVDPGGIKRVQINLKHLLTKEELISDSPFWEKKNVGGYWALDSDKPIAGLNGAGAQVILSGGLLASDAYTDKQFIPANGIHAKGFVQSDEGFFNRYWKANVRNPIWSFGNAQTYGLSYYQGSAHVFNEGIGFHFGDTDNPLHFLDRSGLFYSKQGISSASFTTENKQVLNYANPSTLYIGNPSINNIIESNNNSIAHYKNGVSGVVWDSHNLDPSAFIKTSDLNSYVPYNGAVQDVNLNQNKLTNANLVQSEKFQWYGHSTKPFGQVTAESSFYNLGGNYGYGISTNMGGGLDIMANQVNQPIRLWSGNDNDKPQQVAKFIKDGTKFWGRSYIDINDKEYEILHKGNYTSLLSNYVTLNTPQSISAKKYFTQGLTVNTNYGGLPVLGQMNNIPSKVSATDETYGMGMGIVDSGQGYIQQQRFDGTAHAYDLLLQPSGGNVVVGSNQMDYHNDKLETIGKIVSKGNEMNSVKTYVSVHGVDEIVAGHTFNWYNTSWKVGNMRGGSANSTGYRFEFSNDGGASYEEKVKIHTDGNITTQNYGQAQQWNQAYQWGNHANSGYVKEWENAQAIGFSSGLSAGAPYMYHRTDGYVFLATQSWASGRFVNVDGQQNITGLKIIKGRARNTGTGWGNTSTFTDYSFLIETESGSNTDNQYTGSIGFFSNSGAQAGIYVRSNDHDGTSMAFATTNSFAAGPQISMTIDNQGTVNHVRSRPTFQGNVIWDAGNLTASMIGNWNNKFKDLKFVNDLSLVSESGIYRQEAPSSGFNYTTTLNLNSSDGRQQLTIERTGGGMKFRGSSSNSGDTWEPWRTVWSDLNFSQANINSWNSMASSGIRVNQPFTNITGNGLMVVDNYNGGESGIYNEKDKFYLAVFQDKYYKYSSTYKGWEGINFNKGNKNIGIGAPAQDAYKVNVAGSMNVAGLVNVTDSVNVGNSANVSGSVNVLGTVQSVGNFKSANQEPNTLFIPDGSLAYLDDEITNEGNRMRLSHAMIDQDPGIQYYGSESRMLVIRCTDPMNPFILKECFTGQRILVMNTHREDSQIFRIDRIDLDYRIPPYTSIQLFVWDEKTVYKYAQNRMD
ncbi:hypothetical protein ACQ7CU_03350 [Chryseobacterium arthrosphaerae]|uniref:hypothetical protein n=1 Tax=Chryseobacterium arthrosphaerae TaxID=651561 RepID=UPI003D34596A